MIVTKMIKKSTDKKLAEVLSSGTPKQKALLICTKWTDRNTRRLKPLLTEKEVEAIKNSLNGNEEKKEFNKWIGVYNVYNNVTPLFGLVYKEYQTIAERVLGYLRQWEAYIQEENHLNTIYGQLRGDGGEKGLAAFDEALSLLSFDGAKLKRDKNGYIKIDTEELYGRISDSVDELEKAYGAAKAINLALEEFIDRTRSKKFLPSPLVAAINNIEGDYSVRVAPRYSRRLFMRKKQSGQKITKEEERLAVFPFYEEVKAPSELVDLFRERIRSIAKLWQGK